MESPLPPDPYKALDVAKDASLATIRTAHRKLVLKTHPDKVQGDEELKKKRAEEFHQIQQAYEILCNDARRKEYDDQVKVAALRAEVMAERGGSRSFSDMRPMGGRSPIIEVRAPRGYEERAPRRSWDDSGDDFFSHKPRDSQPKYNDPYTPPSSRKASIRLEEKRRVREIEEERERAEREKLRWDRSSAKAEKKSVYAERTRERDKGRRKAYDNKYRPSYVVDGTETSSDSSDTEITHQPRKREIPRYRYEEVRSKDREEPPRRASKRDTSDGHPDMLESKISSATDYISKSNRQSREPEVEIRRPTMYKGLPTREKRPTPSLPLVSDHSRRSSGRTPARRESSPPPRLSAKNRRVSEIVDPPEDRRPSLPASSSDPKGLRNLASFPNKKPPRASALDQIPEVRQPGIRRAETMPINRSRPDSNQHPRSSREKDYDSDYSNPETPPRPSPKSKSGKILNVPEDEEISRDYKTIYVTPGDKHRRDRNISPPKQKSSERPPMSGRAGTSTRMPTTRSTSYAPDADELRPPRLKRAETAHVSPLGSRQSANNSPRQYFGEILQTEEPYKIKYQSPRIGPDNIRYGRYERRDSEDTHPDWAPGSDFDSRHRPSYSRSTSRVY
ncbi:MAG: hypothetical protein Q9201_007439 [Fulgogasparrea decipioides]